MWTFEEANAMRTMVGRTYAYYGDSADEFKIMRETGEWQGIFKVWAVPVIPFLDTGNIEVLSVVWPALLRPGGYNSPMAQPVSQIMEDWRQRCRQHPGYLARSLERARLYSWLADQRLADLYNHEPMAEDLPARLSQLVNRLQLALGLLNPFYHLEVLADNLDWFYPEGGNEAPDQLAGRLDAAGILLPSVFNGAVIAEQSDWRGLSWPMINEQTQAMIDSDPVRRKILLNLARILGCPPEHILFAANALAWIGGKKPANVLPGAMLEQFSASLSVDRISPTNVPSVLAEANALIRFLNWLPLREGEDNFTGRNWSYASVCDTAGELFQVLSSHPQLWRKGWGDIWREQLSPQLQNLDAASARGRFLLQLILEERCLRPEYAVAVDNEWQERAVKIITSPEATINVPSVSRLQPMSLMGGKTHGLALAARLLESEQLSEGFYLSSSLVEQFLKSQVSIWRQIIELDRETKSEQKLLRARTVEKAIANCPLPAWLIDFISRGLGGFAGAEAWVVRSAAQEESEARGVYKTITRVLRSDCQAAVAECIASYYSQSAVSFRLLTGVGDLPAFAVILGPYYIGCGGGGRYLSDGQIYRYTVSIGESAEQVTSGQAVLHEWSGAGSDLALVADDTVQAVVAMLGRLGSVFRPLQIEWTQDSCLRLLQMEILPADKSQDISHDQSQLQIMRIDSVSDVAQIRQRLESGGKICLGLELADSVPLNLLQESLLELQALFGRRIIKIRLGRPLSQSSHFANICRYLGIDCQ